MTELEKIARAKMYMDKLANGIDPLSDWPVPEEELINNVRLSRCFFFVADVLRQVLENGGTKPAKRTEKVPLAVPVEVRSRFAYSETPIAASEIARRVNDLIDTDKMKKLSYAGIAAWLLEAGLLEQVQTSAGRQRKRPTENGRAMGISIEDRVSQNGPYQVVVYNTEAQRFIVDNLDAIIALAHMSKKRKEKQTADA